MGRFQTAIDEGARAAEELLAELEATWASLVESWGAYAARRLSTDAITAAAAWIAPTWSELAPTVTQAVEAEGKTAVIRAKMIEAAMAPALVEFGLTFDVRNPLVERVLEQLGTKIQGITETQRAITMSKLDEAHRDGLSIPNAAKLIQEHSSGQYARNRATVIARTELAGAQNGGSWAAARLVGIASKQWLATGDNRTRPTHRDADGQEVEIDGYFAVGVDLLRFPGDPNGSAAEVIQCRCTVVYPDDTLTQSAPPPQAGYSSDPGDLDYGGGSPLPSKYDVSDLAKALESKPPPAPHMPDPFEDPLPFDDLVDPYAIPSQPAWAAAGKSVVYDDEVWTVRSHDAQGRLHIWNEDSGTRVVHPHDTAPLINRIPDTPNGAGYDPYDYENPTTERALKRYMRGVDPLAPKNQGRYSDDLREEDGGAGARRRAVRAYQSHMAESINRELRKAGDLFEDAGERLSKNRSIANRMRDQKLGDESTIDEIRQNLAHVQEKVRLASSDLERQQFENYVRQYTSDLHEAIANMASHTPREFLDDLDRAFAEAPPLDQPILVHRKTAIFLGADQIEALEGEVFREHAYLSTAWDDLDQSGSGIDDTMHWEITVPRGARVLDVGAISREMGEAEILLNRDTKLLVTSVERKAPQMVSSGPNSGSWIIKAKVIA